MNGALSLAFAPLLPWPVIAGFALLAAGLVGYALLRRAKGALARAGVALLLLLAVCGPLAVREQRQALPDVALVVMDRSPSQSLGDRTARADAALADIQKKLGNRDDLELRVVSSTGAGATGAADPSLAASSVDETHLFDLIASNLGDVPQRRRAGVVLITDGQVHDVPTPQAAAEEIGAPVHTLLTGNRNEGDRRLRLVSAPTYGIVGQEVTATLRVEDLPLAQAGAPPSGGTAWLTLRTTDGAEQRLQVPLDTDYRLPLKLDRGGQNVFELQAEAGPQELTLANNRAAVIVNGVRDRLKVLLVSGEPHQGERTFRNLLKADPSVDLVHFTILRPPEKQDDTPIDQLSLIAFPIRELFEVKLKEFDLIIFDRYKRMGVLPNQYLQNIADYVNDGGAFLEASGPAFASPMSLYQSPMGAILPGAPTNEVLEQPFRPHVTALGHRHPVTEGLPGDTADGDPSWGRWFRIMGTTTSDGSVVMDGPGGRPLLLLKRVGQGRIAQLTSDQIWLWSRGFDGGGPQAELLRRVAHWLMKEPELEENELRVAVSGARLTVSRSTVEDRPPQLTVTGPSGKTQQLTLTASAPGHEAATLTADEPGIWRFTDGQLSAVAVVGTVNPPELADMRTTPDRIAPVAARTGGGTLWLADELAGPGGLDLRRTAPDRPAAGAGWLGLRRNDDHLVTGVEQQPLLPAWAVFLLALPLLAGAWTREGR